MLFPDKSTFITDDLFVMLLLLTLGLFLLFLVHGEVCLGDGDDFDGFLRNFVFREDLRGIDVSHVLWVFDVEQIVVLFDQLVRLERSELEVAEHRIFLVVQINQAICLTIAASISAITVTAFSALGAIGNLRLLMLTAPSLATQSTEIIVIDHLIAHDCVSSDEVRLKCLGSILILHLFCVLVSFTLHLFKIFVDLVILVCKRKGGYIWIDCHFVTTSSSSCSRS